MHFAVLVIGEDVEDALAPYGDYTFDYYDDSDEPSPEWDSYTIGGRWKGSLILKGETEPPERVDSAYVEHVDWDRMDAVAREEMSEYWDDARKALSAEEFKRIYGNCSDKEAYLHRHGQFGTYAVLCADGTWHDSGTVNAGATFRETFIDGLPEGTRVTIVDCHV